MSINAEEPPEDQREVSLNEASLKQHPDVLDVIGGHGPWQFRHWIVFLAASLCNSMVLFSVLFLPSQTFCFLQNSTEATLSNINGSAPYPEKRSYNHSSTTNCSSPDCTDQRNRSRADDPLSKYFYHTECSNSEIEIFAKCIYVIACAMSAVLVYFSTKRFGCRPVSLASCLLLVASSLAVSFTDAAPAFLILRFITSLAVVNVYFISAYSLVEYVHMHFKFLYFITGHLGWGLAHFLLPLVSWLAEDWMSFNLGLTVTCTILSLLVWLCPESPSSFPSGGGQLARSRKALKYAAFTNGYSTTDVDLLPHGCHLRQENKNDLQTLVTPKEKVCRTLYCCILFMLSFTTTFLYFSAKWHPEWFKVRSGRVSFSFIGTTELAGAIILLFLTCVVSIKYLWAVVSTMTSVLMVLIYFRNKPDFATSSAKLFTITVFFSAAAWTLLLIRTFCHKLSSTTAKMCLIVTGVAVFSGALAASTVVLKATHQDLLLVFAVPHLIAALSSAFIPDEFFGSL